VGVNGLIPMTRSGNANARGNTIFKEPISRRTSRRRSNADVFDSAIRARGPKSRRFAILLLLA